MSVETNMETPLEHAYVIPEPREAEPETFPHLVGVELETADSEVDSNDELLAKVREGDKDAYALLFNRYRGLLHWVVGQGMQELSEDIVQEAFIRTSTRVDQYEDRGYGIGPWLKSVTVNLTRDELKSRQVRVQTVELDDEYNAAANDNTERSVLARIALQQVFDSLLPHHWELVESLYVNGETEEEYRKRNNLSVEVFKARIYRMRTHLRKLRDQGIIAA